MTHVETSFTIEVDAGSSAQESVELPTGAAGGMLEYATAHTESDDDPTIPSKVQVDFELVAADGDRGVPAGSGHITVSGHHFPSATRTPYREKNRLQVNVQNNDEAAVTLVVEYFAFELAEWTPGGMTPQLGQQLTTWPAGYTVETNDSPTNSSGAAGNVEVRISPGAGNQFQLEGGRVSKSTAANTATVDLQDGSGTTLVEIVRDGANANVTFPTTATGPRNLAPTGDIIVAGTERIRAIVESVADGDSITVSTLLRSRFEDPTVTTVTP